MFPAQFVHGLRVGTNVPLQLFNTLLMLRPKQQREKSKEVEMRRGEEEVEERQPVGTNKSSVNGCRA